MPAGAINRMIRSDFESRRVEVKFHGDAYACAFVDRPSSVKREATSHSSLNAIAAVTGAKTFIFSLSFQQTEGTTHIHVHMHVVDGFAMRGFIRRGIDEWKITCIRCAHSAYSFNQKTVRLIHEIKLFYFLLHLSDRVARIMQIMFECFYRT